MMSCVHAIDAFFVYMRAMFTRIVCEFHRVEFAMPMCSQKPRSYSSCLPSSHPHLTSVHDYCSVTAFLYLHGPCALHSCLVSV